MHAIFDSREVSRLIWCCEKSMFGLPLPDDSISTYSFAQKIYLIYSHKYLCNMCLG